MIKSLSINNYALIESLEMTPSPFLNIITGETGAGKSIMLGAVGLLLGNRADSRALFDEESKCVIEGVFDITDYDLKSLFIEEDLDYESECIIRREISPAGKSRAFINDTPVTLDILKNLGSKLMDIHSQHESLDLANNKYQEEILDLYAQNGSIKKSYISSWQAYKKADKHFEGLVARASNHASDLEYKQYLHNELTEANLKESEQAELEAELEILENAEEIKNSLGQLGQLMDESEFSILNQLKSGLPLLLGIKGYGNNLKDFYERLNSVSLELEDLTKEIARETEKVELDPEKLQHTKDRLDLIYRLQQKHQVKSVNELLRIQTELANALEEVLGLDDEIKKAEKDLVACEKAMLAGGEKLSVSREKFAPKFAKDIEGLIKKLGIENATIDITVSPQKPGSTGMNAIEMLFSANKGISPKELKQVASGGEFSRLIFAIKYLLADKTALPTIIFDEIDTGVSGEIAIQMVGMMKTMATKHQVISISHLPQFAARGDAHYFVYKDHSSAKSVSRIKKLDDQERVITIAKMIGGDQPGESAIASAKELLSMK